MSSWSTPSPKVVASVWCITFNHRDFVEDAIRGVLSQETSFPIELIIHDDASTDGTQEVIKKYQQQYPNIIKPILQDENQLSQGKWFVFEYIYPRSSGDFIAWCEGDDYWISTDKLESQVKYMIRNSGVTLTFHKAQIVNRRKKKVGETITFTPFKKFDTETILKNWFISTQTMVLDIRVCEGMQHHFVGVINGDWAFQLAASFHGDVVYLPNLNAAYRKHANSLSRSIIGTNKTYRAMKQIKLFTGFDAYSGFQHSFLIEEKIKFLLHEHYDLLLDLKARRWGYIFAPLRLTRKLFNKFKNWRKNEL